MKTMNRVREWPLVIPSAIIVFVAIALAGLSHTGPTGLYVLIWTGGLSFFLFKLWPEIRNPSPLGKPCETGTRRLRLNRRGD
jgi:hypothetical protein